MGIIQFKKKTKPTEQEEKAFSSFMEALKKEGFEVEVLDGKTIKKNCGKGIYNKVKDALLRVKHREFRFVFEEKGEIVRVSDVRPGWIVINLAHPVEPLTLANLISKTEGEARQFKLTVEELESQKT